MRTEVVSNRDIFIAKLVIPPIDNRAITGRYNKAKAKILIFIHSFISGMTICQLCPSNIAIISIHNITRERYFKARYGKKHGIWMWSQSQYSTKKQDIYAVFQWYLACRHITSQALCLSILCANINKSNSWNLKSTRAKIKKSQVGQLEEKKIPIIDKLARALMKMMSWLRRNNV